MLAAAASDLGHDLSHYQSNAEHELINRIHQAREEGVSFIIINPGALTHTSIALRDALLGVEIPFIEVHLSNVFARESFRQHSYLSDLAIGVISGLGAQGYLFALNAINKRLDEDL
jgi:3-dehydroquinate dehydratase-2